MVICLHCKIKMKKLWTKVEKDCVLMCWMCQKCNRIYQKHRYGKTARYHLDEAYRKAKIEKSKEDRRLRSNAI